MMGNGFGKIKIQPYVPENTTYAKGEFITGYGKISIEWHLTGENEITIHAQLPGGVNAEIAAPDGYTLKQLI